MNNRLLSAALVLVSTCAFAAAKPEISWSIMHPTAIDVDYMRRVAQKAQEYGGVDSFEVCGDCHRGYSGINGLSMLDRYPKAHSKVDAAAVERNRREMNAICEIAHAAGKPLYYWHREIFIPEGLLEDLPGLLDESGEFDLLGKTYQDYLRYKLDETFRHCPGLDGIVLTLTEADYSVIHNSNPKRYPPQQVVEQLVGLFAEEHEKRGKRFILRSFGSNSQDYIDIIGGARRAAERHSFEIETKVTEADFVPWLAKNPFLKKNPPLTLGAECDVLGEYLSAGYLPAAQVGRIREYVRTCREEDADRYTLRIDRVGNSIFDSAHEVNLYAYMRFIADPAATEDEVIAEYAAKRFGAAAQEMAPIVKGELEMIRNIHYVASNLVFHSFPLKSDFKTVKAGGIFSVYRENRSLEATRDIWSILSHHQSPTHERILAEKEKGLAMAVEALAKIEALKESLPPEEYARQHRAFANAVVAAKALRAFATCCVAYFEDMEAKCDDPWRLRAASDEAVKTVESLMRNVNDDFTGRAAYFSVVGDNLDRVYLTGTRYYCRELLNEYRLERAMRRRLEARPEVVDFVIAGGIYDDNRTIRTMHGAYSKTLHDRVVRYAGNPVFPNGTITVKFDDVPGARVEVALDPDGAKECEMTESVADGVRTVTIGKRGKEYPGVLSVALVRPDVTAFKPVNASFARGGWQAEDFYLAKSWRWSHVGEFEQLDDAIVNKVPHEYTPEQVYKLCHDSSYVAMMHKGVFPLGSTVSSTMMFDYRMAPIVVIAPEVGHNPAGIPEFRDHWEVCIYDQGINIWYHYFENGVQKWYKNAALALPPAAYLKAGEKYDVRVRLANNSKGEREMTVNCGGFTLSCVNPKFPETFRAGIIACEGRNFFYDFKARVPSAGSKGK